MSASSKPSLKLLIDETTNRVVFAEANKETIDFLLSLLTLPIGTVVRLLSEQGMPMVGGLVNLYGSIESLNVQNLLSNDDKDLLLKPNAPYSRMKKEIPLSRITDSAMKSQFFICGRKNNCTMFYNFVTDDSLTRCPSCGYLMESEVPLVGDLITYMLMDDMVVKPMSTISIMALLKELGLNCRK